jgi:hypothetical protein
MALLPTAKSRRFKDTALRSRARQEGRARKTTRRSQGQIPPIGGATGTLHVSSGAITSFLRRALSCEYNLSEGINSFE